MLNTSNITCKGLNIVDLEKDILKTILIQGMRDDCLDMSNLMGKGDISKEPYDDIISI